MKCPSCSHENRERRRFCSECASPLDALCPSCQALYEPGERYCGECGASLPGNSDAATLAYARTDSQTPRSFAEGRYVVRKYLGEGKSKRVYLVHDSTLDRDVALALLKTDGIDESERERILREAQTMARLGEHPNVMPVYDLGYDGDLPFMVMPVMTGGSVDTLLRTSEQHRFTLEQALPVALGVCNGLVFAHSQGIVHRDLKPGNVWLNSDQVPRIGDFGLALSQSANRMTSPDVVVGTPLYMSPEQIRGDELDQRTDLYSLGAMLYEMMAGTTPFSGDSPLAIIGQHLNTAPLAPTWYNQECPRELEALILRLLAKDAGARPQAAADVLEALEVIQSSVSNAQTPGTPPRYSDALVLSSDSSFVGRDREMARLGAVLADSRAGRGRLTMLVGEPGVGKTRMARELEGHAQLRGARVAWGRCFGIPIPRASGRRSGTGRPRSRR